MREFVDFARLRRPGTPNSCLLAPDGLCQHAKPDIAAPTIKKSAEALYRRLLGLAGQRRDWSDLACRDDTRQIRFTARTPILRFRDDVDIQVFVMPGAEPQQIGSQLAIYSRSRLGYSDLGVNRRRIISLLAMLPKS